ncbi:MAG: hypothetical protein KDC44_21515 [Phaeodactylibacter sp.]|nr:hypothetical protein [Phaeodactylibacter sp.]
MAIINTSGITINQVGLFFVQHGSEIAVIFVTDSNPGQEHEQEENI